MWEHLEWVKMRQTSRWEKTCWHLPALEGDWTDWKSKRHCEFSDRKKCLFCMFPISSLLAQVLGDVRASEALQVVKAARQASCCFLVTAVPVVHRVRTVLLSFGAAHVQVPVWQHVFQPLIAATERQRTNKRKREDYSLILHTFFYATESGVLGGLMM